MEKIRTITRKGTLVFLDPGQIIGVETSDELCQPKRHGVIFHPDLIKGTSLGSHIDGYSFFSYNVNEAFEFIVYYNKSS